MNLFLRIIQTNVCVLHLRFRLQSLQPMGDIAVATFIFYTSVFLLLLWKKMLAKV